MSLAQPGPRDGPIFDQYSSHTLLIRWANEGRSRTEIVPAAVRAFGGRVTWESELVPGLAVVEVPAEHVSVVHELLQSDRTLEFAERDPMASLTTVPNDTNWSSQYAHQLIGLPTAWNVTTSNTTTLIGVIDSGIDYEHPEILPNLWVNVAELGNDEDGDGIVGDVYGASFVSNTMDPCWSEMNKPFDSCDHGTRMSSVIGARGNNNRQLAGVVWSCKMIAVKVFGLFSGPTSDMIQGMEYAYKRGSRLMNCSWTIRITATDIPALRQYFSATTDVLYVFGAANDNANLDQVPHDPDCQGGHWYPQEFANSNLIVVGASDSSDKKWNLNLTPQCGWGQGSNWGAISVDLFAPGVGISELVANDAMNNYSTIDFAGLGTSESAPLVTGVAALILNQHPTWSPSQVKQRIMCTVDLIPGLAGLCVTGYPNAGGRLNAARALDPTYICSP